MTSSQWCFPPKVGVDGEPMSKKSLSLKTCERGTAFLLTAHCLTLPRAQSSHGLIVLETWIPKALAVDWVMASDGWPNSTWRSLIFFLGRAVADAVLLSFDAHRRLTLATQPSRVNLAIQNDVAVWSIDHDVVLVITWNLVSLQEFACQEKQVRTRLGAKLHRP